MHIKWIMPGNFKICFKRLKKNVNALQLPHEKRYKFAIRLAYDLFRVYINTYVVNKKSYLPYRGSVLVEE